MISIEQIVPRLTWQLRQEILYPEELKQDMAMEGDEHGIHFGAFTANKLVGVVSLFQTGTSFQFRKLAVDASVQNMGIGSELLQHITDYAQINNGTLIWCNARVSAINFYLKHDFVQTGKVFSKKGIDYEILEKQITPAEN
jgi:GNAT superfamily N-acetyltransferase